MENIKNIISEQLVTVDGNLIDLELAPLAADYNETELERIYEKITTQSYGYSDDNALDISIVSRMYTKFWTYQTVDHRKHKNYSFSIRDAVATIGKSSKVDRDVVDIEGSLSALFKGVNKALPYPVILTRLNDSIESELRASSQDPSFAQTISRKKFVNIFDSDEVVRLTPKSLIKHYNFPEVDAKALFKNLSNTGEKYFIQKRSSLATQIPAHEVTYFRGRDGSIKVCWDVPIQLKSSYPFSRDEKLASVTLQLDKELPIKSFSLWRNLTKEWYEASKEESWTSINTEAQKRHIVNFIRHSYYGYSQAYKMNDRDTAAVLHDLSFDLIVRRIHKTFPSLSNECKRQLDVLYKGKRES